jgi:hypothetical protein
MTTALEGGEESVSRPSRSLPTGKTRYPLYRRLGGPQGRSGQVRKISPSTGIRSPDRPARSQSLYRIRYLTHLQVVYQSNITVRVLLLNCICRLIFEFFVVFFVLDFRIYYE